MPSLYQIVPVLALCAAVLCAAPAAAQTRRLPQPGGPCDLAPDALLVDVLGPSVYGFQGPAMDGFDLCGVVTGPAQGLAIYRLSSRFDPGEREKEPDDPDREQVDVSALLGITLDASPVRGIGDSAVLRRLQVNGGTLASLRVAHGDDVFIFNAQDSPDAPTRLSALAQAVLANLALDGV